MLLKLSQPGLANSVYSLITMISTKDKDDVIGSFFLGQSDFLVVLSSVNILTFSLTNIKDLRTVKTCFS